MTRTVDSVEDEESQDEEYGDEYDDVDMDMVGTGNNEEDEDDNKEKEIDDENDNLSDKNENRDKLKHIYSEAMEEDEPVASISPRKSKYWPYERSSNLTSPPKNLPKSLLEHPNAERRFREYYMSALTLAFGSDLDKIRHEENFDINRLDIFVNALETGVNIFTDVEKQLALEEHSMKGQESLNCKK